MYLQVKSRLRLRLTGMAGLDVGLIRADKKWSLVTHSSTRECPVGITHLVQKYDARQWSAQYLSIISLLVKAISCGQNAGPVTTYFSAYMLNEIMVNLSGELDEAMKRAGSGKRVPTLWSVMQATMAPSYGTCPYSLSFSLSCRRSLTDWLTLKNVIWLSNKIAKAWKMRIKAAGYALVRKNLDTVKLSRKKSWKKVG